MTGFGLGGRAALLLAGTEETVGLTHAELRAIAQRTDVLINISGMLTAPALLEPIRTRVYLDLDPAFIQIWHAAYGIDMRFAAHTHFVTVGLSIGSAECPVPTCGLPWITTLQPVVLAEWPVAGEITRSAFTTIGNWRGYGSVEFQGEHYGQKAHSLRQFLSLPNLCSETFTPALAIHPEEKKDLAALAGNGWQVLDPGEIADTPDAYRSFIQGSKGELGIAKTGYANSHCGWFSDRSVCYLASGRPVIAQETGFGRYLPCGEGLFAFSTETEVCAAISEINADYARHRRAARAIAEENFESGRVLKRLLEQVEVAA
ncbi:MAG: hypothetical protein K8R23_11375 [Chthoniobacter sp.]|nr:hypothetical protein [Chthoniobacter sp.]